VARQGGPERGDPARDLGNEGRSQLVEELARASRSSRLPESVMMRRLLPEFEDMGINK
jgi:hypothetical protein